MVRMRLEGVGSRAVRVLGLAFIVVFAAALMSASVASATVPTFKPAANQTFKSKGGEGKLENSLNAAEKVVCKTSESTVNGEIVNESEVKKVTVAFKNCLGTGSNGTSTCLVKSKGSSNSSEIVGVTLKGFLGTSKESKTGAAELLEPETGSKFVELEGSCVDDSPVEVKGDVIGEPSPTKSSQTTGKLTLVGAKGSQSIKKVTIKENGTGKEVGKTAELFIEALGFKVATASQNSESEITYSAAVEVT